MYRDFHYTIKPLKNRRRQLRNNPTKAEKILWSIIRNRNLGIKFTRQYSVDGFVIDFYCQSKRYAIEVEGGVHCQPSQIKYDQFRDRFIKAHDIKILKINNAEIFNNIETVVNKILFGVPS